MMYIRFIKEWCLGIARPKGMLRGYGQQLSDGSFRGKVASGIEALTDVSETAGVTIRLLH
jgi:hypothetical protein